VVSILSYVPVVFFFHMFLSSIFSYVPVYFFLC
jgi:hypothetical protein